MEKLVSRTKRNQRKVLRSACRAAGARCAPCGRRCAKNKVFIKPLALAGAAGDAWRVGCWCADCLRCAGRCARAGCIRAVRCAVQDAMQCAAMHGMRCASRCDARDADCLRYNAMHAGWLHSRCRRRHAFDGGILRVGFFWDRLNVHTFDSRHRADRRVEGWLRRDGWFAKVDNRFGYEKWLQGGSIGL